MIESVQVFLLVFLPRPGFSFSFVIRKVTGLALMNEDGGLNFKIGLGLGDGFIPAAGLLVGVELKFTPGIRIMMTLTCLSSPTPGILDTLHINHHLVVFLSLFVLGLMGSLSGGSRVGRSGSIQ